MRSTEWGDGWRWSYCNSPLSFTASPDLKRFYPDTVGPSQCHISYYIHEIHQWKKMNIHEMSSNYHDMSEPKPFHIFTVLNNALDMERCHILVIHTPNPNYSVETRSLTCFVSIGRRVHCPWRRRLSFIEDCKSMNTFYELESELQTFYLWCFVTKYRFFTVVWTRKWIIL